MCLASYTESGRFLGVEKPCPEYQKLEEELFILREDFSSLLDIALDGVLRFDGKYTHGFTGDYELLWKILGLTNSYVPEADFNNAVDIYKQKIGI